MAKAAVKSIKGLIGKQVKLRPRYSDNAEGPFTLIGYDPPYIGLTLEDGEEFWWHTSVIEGIRGVRPDEAK